MLGGGTHGNPLARGWLVGGKNTKYQQRLSGGNSVRRGEIAYAKKDRQCERQRNGIHQSYYIPLNVNEIDSVEVAISTGNEKDPSFHPGDLHCTLHCRKKDE